MTVYVVRRREGDYWVNIGVLSCLDDFERLFACPDDGWVRVHEARAEAAYDSKLPVYTHPEDDTCLALDKFEVMGERVA